MSSFCRPPTIRHPLPHRAPPLSLRLPSVTLAALGHHSDSVLSPAFLPATGAPARLVLAPFSLCYPSVFSRLPSVTLVSRGGAVPSRLHTAGQFVGGRVNSRRQPQLRLGADVWCGGGGARVTMRRVSRH